MIIPRCAFGSLWYVTKKQAYLALMFRITRLDSRPKRGQNMVDSLLPLDIVLQRTHIMQSRNIRGMPKAKRDMGIKLGVTCAQIKANTRSAAQRLPSSTPSVF